MIYVRTKGTKNHRGARGAARGGMGDNAKLQFRVNVTAGNPSGQGYKVRQTLIKRC